MILSQLDARFQEALRSRNPVEGLRSLASELSAEGLSKPAIVELFNNYLAQVQEVGTCEADEDAIRDVLDFLVGRCSPHVRLLPEERP